MWERGGHGGRLQRGEAIQQLQGQLIACLGKSLQSLWLVLHPLPFGVCRRLPGIIFGCNPRQGGWQSRARLRLPWTAACVAVQHPQLLCPAATWSHNLYCRPPGRGSQEAEALSQSLGPAWLSLSEGSGAVGTACLPGRFFWGGFSIRGRISLNTEKAAGDIALSLP